MTAVAVAGCGVRQNSATPTVRVHHPSRTGSECKPPCPHCGDTRVIGRGYFVRKDGTRLRRYLCKACYRSFNPITGTPEARLRKRVEWEVHKRIMTAASPLRKVAATLGIHLTTAFRWRHLFMQALCADPQPPVQGSVILGHAFVPYSEKGSRSSTGPGSYYSRWGLLKRGHLSPFGDGPISRARRVEGAPVFRYCIDARPTRVLLATDGEEINLQIAGNQKPTAESVLSLLSHMIAQGARVLVADEGPYEEACHRLGLIALKCPSPFVGRDAEETRLLRALNRLCGSLGAWLFGFQGVATRYLVRYLAWFRWIRRQECSCTGA